MQGNLLNRFQGYIIDDKEYGFSIFVINDKLLNKHIFPSMYSSLFCSCSQKRLMDQEMKNNEFYQTLALNFLSVVLRLRGK